MSNATAETVPARSSMRAPWIAIALGLCILATATAGLLLEREPFASFYYLFAWYSTLLAADGVVALLGGAGRRGEFLLLQRPAHLVSMAGWSAVVWLFYELLNFRLQNWYYVFLPHDITLRWVGTLVSFATVLPAVFLSEAVMRGFGVARKVRWPALRLTAKTPVQLQIAGAFMMALVLIWPRWFFPLVWGATTLMVEPIVYRRAPERSVLGDLEKGEPGRLLRLLLGGAIIGFIWELYNVRARMKWIYTVPGLEDLKLFEMPVLGFFGFPPFAVECFVLWQLVVVTGVAVPRFGRTYYVSRLRSVTAFCAAAIFSVAVLAGMETRTMSSYGPRLADLPDVPAEPLVRAGFDVFTLSRAAATDVTRVVSADLRQAHQWIESARLATLRGIGTTPILPLRSLGIVSVERLAYADPTVLAKRLQQLTGQSVLPARVRVWVHGARADVKLSRRAECRAVAALLPAHCADPQADRPQIRCPPTGAAAYPLCPPPAAPSRPLTRVSWSAGER
jgi:hypothetical protein